MPPFGIYIITSCLLLFTLTNQMGNSRKAFVIITIILFISSHGAGQANNRYLVLKTVFDTLVNAWGNAKAPPDLRLLKPGSSKIVARYVANPTPSIEVDDTLYGICQNFGPDSLDAIAVVLSHELAHYYGDHTWCSDYAFAYKNVELMKVSKESKVEKESIADNQGLFYAAVAGYHSFRVFDRLIDAIYKTYQLPNISNGYPSKEDRKKIATAAAEKAVALYEVFNAGVGLTCAGYYPEAITCFFHLVKYFPSRENYNNLGVARLLWALRLKPLSAQEFVYPVEIDPNSRLKATHTRSGQTDADAAKMDSLLKAAKKDFEKAISLDPSYTKAYVNLAAVYDLMDNPEGAIGKLKELPQPIEQVSDALFMKGIAYWHLGEEETAKSYLTVDPNRSSSFYKFCCETDSEKNWITRYNKLSF